MIEYDSLKDKKERAEFITPEKLREFIKNEVGMCEDKIIFDPAVGSGQLLYNIKAKDKIGIDIKQEAVECAIKNNIKATKQDYILYDDKDLIYDYVITNYPFSLRPTEDQDKYLCNKYCVKKYTGVLDKEFILKSFRKASKGFYLCFSGISYRGQELSFRQELIDKHYLEKCFILNNCNFRDTSINILYLKLSKQDNKEVVFGEIDFKEDKTIWTNNVKYEDIIKNNYGFNSSYYCPKKEEVIPDIELVNNGIYNNILLNLEKDIKLILTLKEIFDAYKSLTKESIKNDLINIINKYLKD